MLLFRRACSDVAETYLEEGSEDVQAAGRGALFERGFSDFSSHLDRACLGLSSEPSLVARKLHTPHTSMHSKQ